MLNQLTEADREIDRLKAELSALQEGKRHLLLVEELNRVKEQLAESEASAIDREYYERELNEKSHRLHEALVTLEMLGDSLKDTERRLQLKEATLRGLGFHMEDGRADPSQLEGERLREQLAATEAKLAETDELLQSTEGRCRELQAQNAELKTRCEEAVWVGSRKLLEAQNERRTTQTGSGEEGIASRAREEATAHVVDEERMQTDEKQVVDDGVIQEVVGDLKMKSVALSTVLEMLVKVDCNVEKMRSDWRSTLLSTDRLETAGEERVEVSERLVEMLVAGVEFWSQLLGAIKVSPGCSQSEPSFERRVAERMVAEKSALILVSRRAPQMKVDGEETMSELVSDTVVLKDLVETLREKVRLFTQIASAVTMSTNSKLMSLILASFSGSPQKRWSEYLSDAMTEAHNSYLLSRLKFQHVLQPNASQVQTGSSDCPNCLWLQNQNRDLQCKLQDLQNRLSDKESQRGDDQTTTPKTHIQIEGEPIDSLDKAIQLQDMIAKHKKELREVKDVYEREAEKLRQEVAMAGETLRLLSEENVKEIDSLTVCMENLKRKHEAERGNILERFQGEIDRKSVV